MSRPRKNEEHRRTRTVIFRVTQSEFEKLERKAEEANLRVNEIARIASLSNASRIVVQAYATNDPALLKRLQRIGHNLNQLVKNAHIFGRVSPKVEELCFLIESIVIEAASKEWDK